MSASVTVTGKVGPGNTLTAGVFSNVVLASFNCATNILQLTQSDPNRVLDVSIAAATTITVTKSGSSYTFAIS